VQSVPKPSHKARSSNFLAMVCPFPSRGHFWMEEEEEEEEESHGRESDVFDLGRPH
jgi:hypothetical protein